MQICLNSPLPSFDSIMASFRPLMTWPPKFPELPKFPRLMFPSLPWPLLPGLRVPNFELMVLAIELQAFQLQTTILMIIKPILSKLGMAIDAFLPKIPGLPELNLLDLVSGNFERVVAAVKAALLRGFRLPGWPFPLYVSMRIPDFEVIQTLQAIVTRYMGMVATLIPDLINKVVKKFKLKPGLPAIPKLPTMDEVIAMVASMVPGLPDIPSLEDLKESVMAQVDAAREGISALQAQLADAAEDARAAIEAQIAAARERVSALMSKIPAIPEIPSVDEVAARVKAMVMDSLGNFDVMSFMAKLKFPGLPALPSFPLPMMFSFKMPDIEFTIALTLLVNHLTAAYLKPILDFVLKVVSKVVGFTFPKLCATIPVPAMPTLPSLEIPEIKIPTVVLPPVGR